MAATVRHFRARKGVHPARLLALLGAVILTAPLLSGCKLVDQRTFNPNAGRPPQPVVPPAPPAPPAKPPFLQIRSGTPESEYGPIVDRAVRAALAHKANVLFIVQGLAPMQASPDEQARVLTDLTKKQLAPLGARIARAGAQPIQIEMHAATDPSLKDAVMRVDVR
ncbi:hypothetical protein [Gluconobacter morbifer]|uniref:Uncharacterized protein n=1 Tax=Gluconobacter morbifer G707 TaxID=1088869 RepID=G6XL52_9PROT|nr:hypothetical protein [Gluconobacter morbifer]EHH67480.1 hypothetical protein GMO_24750 [Gluconobacter morbifer G707]